MSVPASETGGAHSRRSALALMLMGAGRGLPGSLFAADAGAPVRLAISESLVGDVSINDARAAMRIWLRRLMADLNVVIEFNPNVFDTAEEILRRARNAQFDCVALNIVEYRQIANWLDSREIICEAGTESTVEYLLLVKRGGEIRQLGHLRGRRLCVLKGPRMCAAGAWLSIVLDDGHFGPSAQFFSSVAEDAKVSRVVLPVFFGQADACLTSKTGFDTMCELNPQVRKDLVAIAVSPAMVTCFYIFHRNCRGSSREKFEKVYSHVRASAAGRQLATLFQFDSLTVRGASCLASALGILDRAERVRGGPGGGSG